MGFLGCFGSHTIAQRKHLVLKSSLENSGTWDFNNLSPGGGHDDFLFLVLTGVFLDVDVYEQLQLL